MLKSSLLFKKNANFTCKQLENYKDLERKTFRVILSYKHEHIGRFCVNVPLMLPGAIRVSCNKLLLQGNYKATSVACQLITTLKYPY